MKKIILIVLVGFLYAGFLSCSPETLSNETNIPQACCGDEIPPPPPPPPGGGGND